MGREAKRISMAAVAEAAGVSQATVSRVLAGKPGVSAEKADQIRALAKRLGYNMPVRSPGPKSRAREGIVHGAIAVLLVNRYAKLQTFPVFDAILQGVASAAHEHGLNLVLARVTRQEELPECVIRSRVDGLLLAGAEPDEDLLLRLARFPSVSLSSRHTRKGDHVLPGREEVGRLAAQYLLERGHTRVAYLNVTGENPAFRVQGASFRDSIQEKAAHVEMLTDVTVPMRTDDLGEILREVERAIEQVTGALLAFDPRPTGLFLASDMIAAALYRVLRRKGADPAAFDIISCNNEQAFLAGLYPRPATIDIGAETLGRRAVERLLWRMQHRSEVSRVQVTIEPVLVRSPDASA